MEPALTLSTLDPERPLIAIESLGTDGKSVTKTYKLASMDDFGLRELAEMSRFMVDLQRVKSTLADAPLDDISKVEAETDRFIKRIVISLDNETLAKLTLAHKTAIFTTFKAAALIAPSTAEIQPGATESTTGA